VLVKSRGGEPPIEQSQGGVRMQLSLETTLATAVFFQKGDVKTGISISGADARRMGDSVQFTLDLKRENNSAFLGHVRVELVNAPARPWPKWRTWPRSITRCGAASCCAPDRRCRRAPTRSATWSTRSARPSAQGPTKAEAVRGTVGVH
jgi:hypothetical protein